MSKQAQVRELIQQWETAFKKMEGLAAETEMSQEFQDAASVLVWTFIQLKEFNYRMSETTFWYHPSEAN